jgi:hypothetical protein
MERKVTVVRHESALPLVAESTTGKARSDTSRTSIAHLFIFYSTKLSMPYANIFFNSLKYRILQ